MNNIKVGLFGGTFDPPHIGHKNIALKLIENNKINKLYFLPCKNSFNKDVISSLNDRINMLKIITNKQSNIHVLDIENQINLPEIYFIDTLKYFKEKYKYKNIAIIIGLDKLIDLHNWKNSYNLIKENEFIIYNRKNNKISIKNILETIKNKWEEKLATKLIKSIVYYQVFNISSEQIKKNIKNKEKIVKFLDKDVLDYIIKNKLFIN